MGMPSKMTEIVFVGRSLDKIRMAAFLASNSTALIMKRGCNTLYYERRSMLWLSLLE